MLKNKIVLEEVIEDRKYSLVLSPDSPLGEIYDVLCRMRGFIIQQINAENEAQEKKEV